MIKPAITPRRITGNATTGLISAAKSGVRNIQSTTETISNAPDVTKDEKFGINYVGFFGSKKVNKDLKKSMKTIKESVGSTFGIAKSLKESVTKGAGVFGFVGKLIGGAAMALPIFGLLGIPLLKGILGILAIGGIAALFNVFKKPIINFFKRTAEFKTVIEDMIKNYFIGSRTSAEFKAISEQSQSRIDQAVKEDGREDRQQAVVEATKSEIAFLEKQLADYKQNSSKATDPNYDANVKALEDRIGQLQDGKLDLRKGKNIFKNLDIAGGLANRFANNQGVFNAPGYRTFTPNEKFDTIRGALEKFGSKENIDTAKLVYQQQLKGKLKGDEKELADDIIKFLEMFGDDPLGKIEENEKKLFLDQLNSTNIKPQELSSNNVKELGNNSSVSGGSRRGNAGNVSMIPMGNKSNQLVANDTGGLTSGPDMKIHLNFDPDNFIAPINMANFNVV
tara:strand:+ start:105 stop:1457 length:1353 start_codon:yes stop_codon:yes gene_type:complete